MRSLFKIGRPLHGRLWDTTYKYSELANYSVCATCVVKDRHLYLLNVYRRKLDFPNLKKAVRELAKLHQARVVLIEDKASGTSLIQELRSEHFSIVQAAPDIDGDKITRLRAQTTKIEGEFVLFPKEAPWLHTYLSELLAFPNSKYTDQVDSTVFALAWSTAAKPPFDYPDEALEGLLQVFGGFRPNFHIV